MGERLRGKPLSERELMQGMRDRAKRATDMNNGLTMDQRRRLIDEAARLKDIFIRGQEQKRKGQYGPYKRPD